MQGGDLLMLKEMLDRSSMGMVERYVHLALLIAILEKCSDSLKNGFVWFQVLFENIMDIEKKATIIQIVKIKTELSLDELLEIARERAPQLRQFKD